MIFRIPSYLYSILLLFVTNILLTTSANESQQYGLHARISITSSQTRFTSPYLILMSKNEISIAQLPLIENGAVSVIYSLDGNQTVTSKDEAKEGTAIDQEDSSSTFSSSSPLGFSSPTSSWLPNADAREYEQMPSSQIQQTSSSSTTSLGKSEWPQQIATKSNNNKSFDDAGSERSIEQEVVRSSVDSGSVVSKENEKKEDVHVDGNPERKEINRPRRSNSLEDRTGDDRPSRGNNAANNGVASSLSNALESLRLSSPKENVTSARFRRGTSDTSEDREEVEKKEHTKSYTNIASPQTPEDDKNSALQFTDFDIHMAQGYAFVADSIGRIHRFKLPGTESEDVPTNPDGVSISNSLGKENDYANTIDVEKAKTAQYHQNLPRLAAKTFSEAQNSYSSGDDKKYQSSNNVNHADEDANKVLQSNNVTHEQSGRHPTASGLESSLVSNVMPDSVLLNTEETFNVNRREQHKALASGRPRIIWSRSKHVLSEIGLKNEHHPVVSGLQKSSSGAFPSLSTPVPSDNQMVDENKHMGGASSNEILATTDNDSEEGLPTENSGLESSTFNELENGSASQISGALGRSGASLTSQIASGKKKPGTHLRTEIAVDWLNNLLFVLDKHRLFVTDFDGNNELVLIDDFNRDSRPIDIKLDPVNSFLFWLQVGNFHNTIYKLDLSVLSMQAATGKLLANASKTTASPSISHKSEQMSTNPDTNSELVALTSHHYAQPIITNLPQHARLFIIDHKHSKIYVPLSSKNKQYIVEPGCNKSNGFDKEEVENFQSSEEGPTHMNSTVNKEAISEQIKNCTTTIEYTIGVSGNDQILAYNLDGSDVGPLRNIEEKTHLTGLNDVNDFTLDAEKGYLYWLTNEGKELFEEFKSDQDSTYSSAMHSLDGRKYKKLIYFGSNQPTEQPARINLKKFIQLLSATALPNRQIRSDGLNRIEDGKVAYSLNNRRDQMGISDTKHLPYIISAMTCLIVLAIYLVYSFIFQSRPRRERSNNPEDGSISGISSSIGGSHIDYEGTTDGYMANSTIPKLIIDSSTSRHSGASPSKKDSIDSPRNSCMIASTDFNTNGTAISQHYGGLGITTLSRFPSNINYMPNEHYVPVEVLSNEALLPIKRIEIDQLKIDERILGRGHFGEVKMGKIACTRDEETCPLHGTKVQSPRRINMLVDSATYTTATFDDMNRRVGTQSSTGSSGHGSSSTSYEFTTGPCNMEVSNGDYLTPRGQCNSSMSDYAVENQTFSRPYSYSSYYNSSVCASAMNNQQEQSKSLSCHESNEKEIRVAIKQLKLNASDDEKMDFLNEAVKLANLNHPNIVQLVGICLDSGHKMIIMELMLGDLISYMHNNPSELSEDELFKICLDIVNGCCCLESQGIVHRDLAARNCLVSRPDRGERVVKLADFGLARDIHKDSHYKKYSDSPMPFKWMAPESLDLSQRRFTTKSDVWSFGVVMWEVMNKCKEKPFAYEDPGSMPMILEKGHRLKKPKDCCDQLYNLMTDCWQLEEGKRPTFQECRAELIEIRNSRSE